jgi:hypothetical protein
MIFNRYLQYEKVKLCGGFDEKGFDNLGFWPEEI